MLVVFKLILPEIEGEAFSKVHASPDLPVREKINGKAARLIYNIVYNVLVVYRYQHCRGLHSHTSETATCYPSLYYSIVRMNLHNNIIE